MNARVSKPFHVNLTATTDHEKLNLAKVMFHVNELAKLPTVEALAVMPDACPAGQAPGTIPVGGVAKTGNAIHPGMHSADVCCSLALTNLGQVDPKLVLDTAMQVTHFGAGGRTDRIKMPRYIEARMRCNSFLAPLLGDASAHFGTQGDGNHFLYVGRLESTGDTVVVTHHGSRKPGAMLYKQGLIEAKSYMKFMGYRDIPMHNAWMDYGTLLGENYWDALKTIRLWTKASHEAIHDKIASRLNADPIDRFWNEHNFVFRRDDSFYHAKGATPSFAGFSPDDDGRTLIPLNCAEPILIAAHADAPNGLGFAPHGAGRNFSRKEHLSTLEGLSPEQIIKQEIGDLDFRSFNGKLDLSELPSAYKSADKARAEIDKFGLAKVTDMVIPYGSIMAGEQHKPWLKKRKAT